ncbi:hypothetical protein [uncultured Lutibacter sp.]|uniref:hypothetical protein n=1 Tax=uncultured Lutibacter sp. TaxID=437739 RepID=UPI002610094F|nr:hypothetical protein [uncultured Lutibacter sp.]
MAFSFSNILKPKKEKTPKEVLPKIEFKGGTIYAEDVTNNVYLDFEELGGFPFIKTIIIGDLSTKIKRTGCTLTFIFENDSLTLNSDNTDIESNKIKNTASYYTEIDFELNEEEAKKIKNEKVKEIQYNFKGKVHTYKKV